MNDILQFVNVVVYLTLLLLLLIFPLKLRVSFLVIFFVFGLSVIIFSVLPSLRTISYGDTKNYFDYYVAAFEFDRFELGYSWLTEISLGLGLDFREYIFLIATITSMIYVHSLYKHLKFGGFEIKSWIYAVLSSLVFFSYYYMFFEAIRDGISTSIIMLAMAHALVRHLKVYYCLVLVAFLFHKAAIVFIIPAVLYRFYSCKNTAGWLFLFALVFTLSFLIKSLLLNMNFLGDKIIYLLSYYAEDQSASNTVVVRYCIILISCLLYLNLTNGDGDTYGRRLHVFIVCTLISFAIFASFPDMYRRLLLKLEYISYPLIIMSCLSKYKSSRLYLYFSIFLVLYYVVFMSNYYSYYSLLNIKAVVEL